MLKIKDAEKSGALEKLKKTFPSSRLFAEDVDLESYQDSTVGISRRPLAVVFPLSVQEVQQVVRICKGFPVSLYPISTGKNWGYGSANATIDSCVILDLSKMNKVLEVNEKFAYAVIEPGVTQANLYNFLKERKLDLFIDPSGAGPNTSILGNSVERGYGLGRYSDHFLSICGMEVVLANGEVLKTGFGHYDGSRSTHLYKWGLGPFLDGIFTQSNLGIVTKIGVWLQPKPEHVEVCYFSSAKKDSIFSLAEKVRELLLHDCFSSAVNLVSRDRILAMGSKKPESDPLHQELAKDKSIQAWNGVTALYGSRAEVSASKRKIKKELSKVCEKVVFVSEKKLSLLGRYTSLFSFLFRVNISTQLENLRASFGILSGKPSEISLPLAYWKNKKKTPPKSNINPAKDKCGLIWFTPIVPISKEDLRDFIELSEPILKSFGFDYCPTFTSVTARAFDCSLPILFDRENESEQIIAAECYEVLFKTCKAKGFIPYRLGVQSMNEEAFSDEVFWGVVKKIKNSLDPDALISPGRYCRP